MPWTKRPDVTIADALAFEEMLDEIAEQDRTARLRDAYMPRYHDLAFDRLRAPRGSVTPTCPATTI